MEIYTDADTVGKGADKLIAIALGTAVTDGMLLRGFFDVATYFQGTFSPGSPVYVSKEACRN